jgi:hypothetical protein
VCSELGVDTDLKTNLPTIMITQTHTPKVPGYIDLATGRVALSLQQFYDLGADVTGYIFLSDDEEMGLDPWREVDDLDPHVDCGGFDIWFASGASLTLQGGGGSDQVIYVHKSLVLAAPEQALSI